MKATFKKFCKWQEDHCERMRKLTGITHMQMAWISFAKGLLLGMLLMLLVSCANTKSADVGYEDQPRNLPTLFKLDAMSKVLTCMFAPETEECKKLREETKNMDKEWDAQEDIHTDNKAK